MSLTVYLNGRYLPYEQAAVPIEDRAFLFADGIYEVIRIYDGRPFAVAEHLDRLARSARGIRLPHPDLIGIDQVSRELIKLNDIREGIAYVQISRGAYNPRTHAFPAGPVIPTVLVLTRPVAVTPDLWASGVAAVTVPDTRGSRCDIKSVSLLANALAKQAAADAGAYEAIFVRDGYSLEGSSSNFMVVLSGEIHTYPKCNYILGGITRQVVLKLAHDLGYTVREEGVPVERLKECAEMWVTSTTAEVMPIVTLDGNRVGDGVPGPITRALQTKYFERSRG